MSKSPSQVNKVDKRFFDINNKSMANFQEGDVVSRLQ